MTRKQLQQYLPLLCGLASIAVIWGVWEASGRTGWKVARVLPPPSIFLKEMVDSDFRVGLGSQSASILWSVISSCTRVVCGLFLGFALALPTGFLMASSRWLRWCCLPIIQILAPIAPIAWIPLAIVLLGIGNQTAIFIVFMGVFFTLTIATVQAVEDVPEQLSSSARTLGATKWQVAAHVKAPYILPKVFLILRLNFIGAWMAVLAAEMTGLRDGLGAVIMIGRNLFNSNLILMGMCLIGIVGFVFDLVLRHSQKTFFWWGDK